VEALKVSIPTSRPKAKTFSISNIINTPGKDVVVARHAPHQDSTGPPSNVVSKIPEKMRPEVSQIPDKANLELFLPSKDMNFLDLELLHNYTTSTCNTLSAEGQEFIWQTSIPQVGFKHKYALRAILAVSALHIAYHRQQRKEFYMSQAFAHYHAAVQEASPFLSHVNQDNCTGLYVFTTMTVFFAFASHGTRNTDLCGGVGDPMTDWLRLCRGPHAIDRHSLPWLKESSLGGLLERGVKRNEVWLEGNKNTTSIVDNNLLKLERIIRRETDDARLLSVYMHTIMSMQSSFMMPYDHVNRSHDGFMFWVLDLSNEYIDMLHRRNPQALCILAYSCKLLSRADDNWWMTGCAKFLMSEIYHSLEPRFRPWIHWPIQQLGWMPDDIEEKSART